MKNKPLLLKEELSRIFELMNIGFNPNILLESGGGGGTTIAKSLMPGESKTIDNLVTTLAKSENDLLTYSAKLASMAPNGTFDEIAQKIAADSGKPVDDLTDQMVKDWIKTQPGLMDDLQAAATKIAKEAVDKEIADFNIQSIFDNLATSTGNASLKDFPQQFAGIIGIKVTDANKGSMSRYLDGMQKIVDEMPDSEAKLKMEEQIGGKRTQMDNLSGKASTVVSDIEENLGRSIINNLSRNTTDGVVDFRKFLDDTLDELENPPYNLIKYPKGVTREAVIATLEKQWKQLYSDLETRIKMFDDLDPTEQATWANKAIQDLKGAKTKIPDEPSWLKRTFFKTIDETGQISVSIKTLKWKKVVGAYLTIGALSGFGCLVKNAYDVKSGEQKVNETLISDVTDCFLMTLTWIIDLFGYPAGYIKDKLKTYENNLESFKEFLKEQEGIDVETVGGVNKNDEGKYFYFYPDQDPVYYIFKDDSFVKQ